MPFNRNATLCHSVHQETNGRHILVGVVAGLLQTEEPVFFQEYSLFLVLEGLSRGETSLQIRLTDPSQKTGISNYTVNIDEDGETSIVVIEGIPFRSELSGKFKMDFRLSESKRWQSLLMVSVQVNASTHSGPAESS